MRRTGWQATMAALALGFSMTATTAVAQEDSGGHTATTQEQQDQAEAATRDVYRSEHAYFGDKLTIVPSIQYTHSDRNQMVLNGFLVLDAIFLGNINVDKVTYDTLQASLGVRYDLTDRWQLQATIPYLVRRGHFESVGAGGASTSSTEQTVTSSGLGDISARLYYHALRETADHPDLVLYAGFRAPTGKDPYGISTKVDPANSNLRYPSELPTGNGAWSALAGASIVRTYDPAVLFASFGYEHTFSKSFDDISSDPSGSPDTPGKIDLGDVYRFGVGTAFALNRRLSLSVSYNHAFTTEAKQTPDGGRTQKIVGSEGSTGALNLGMTLAMSNTRTLVTNLAIGVTNDAPDVSLSLSMPFSL